MGSLKAVLLIGLFIESVLGGLINLEPDMMPLIEHWPELIGMSSLQATLKLHQHFPKIQVVKIFGMPETSHIELNKIFLYVNDMDKVIFLPTLYSKVPMNRSWPELVGETIENAENVIYGSFPVMQFDVVKYNSISVTTEEFNPMRVKVVVDENGIVVEPPTNKS